MRLGRWIARLFGRAIEDKSHPSSADQVQIQVFYNGEGWQNAGMAPSDPATLKSRMDEALARHGGEAVRAIDDRGRIIDAA